METNIDMNTNELETKDNATTDTISAENTSTSELDKAHTDKATVENESGNENASGNEKESKPETTPGNGQTAKKVAGLPLTNSSIPPSSIPPSSKQSSSKQTGTKAAGSSLQNRLSGHESANRGRSRRNKVFLYSLSALVLGVVSLYFYTRIRNLMDESHTGLRTPDKTVRIDSTARKMDSPAKAYEKEAKSRYQDSLRQAIEKDAMGHIVMDWGKLYDVKRYDHDNEENPEFTGKPTEDSTTLTVYSEKSLYDRLRQDLFRIENQEPDSLSAQQKRVAATQSNKAAVKGASTNPAARRGLSRQGSGKAANQNSLLSRSRDGSNKIENSLFNVVHGSAGNYPMAANSRASNSMATSSVNGNRRENSGRFSNSEPDRAEHGENQTKIAETRIAETVIVRAVVHGNHKVKAGSKVAFRLLEPVTFQGGRFEKNTILIGIATFKSGRVNFSDFRSKSLSSVSASHGAVASTPLPMVCYDTDMVAGISVTDQSPLETQTRQAGTSALADAANDASYSIPYGSLARAASSLTRGMANGKRQAREQFIDLADNYPVLLELMPPGQK